MGKVLLKTGEYAKTPYYFENLGIRVFSAEELCYVLKENAFLLDREIVDKRLVRWIDESLKLKELAISLYPLLHQKTSVGAFVGIILQYIHFYDDDTVRQVEDIYKKSANLNIYEKLKTRIDHMTANEKYGPALLEYDTLLSQLPEGEEELTAKILHNKGVALCGLFLFEEAAEHFMRSYTLLKDEETLVEYLAAKRLSMDDGEYISFAAGLPEYYEQTLELEKRVEVYRSQWEETKGKQYLDDRLSWKAEGDVVKYYEETDRKLQELKNRYIHNVNN